MKHVHKLSLTFALVTWVLAASFFSVEEEFKELLSNRNSKLVQLMLKIVLAS